MSADPQDVRFVLEAVLGGSEWYQVTSAEADGDRLRLGIRVPGDDRAFGVELPAPWSDHLQPWLYVTPIDLCDWTQQLHTWLEEEFATLAVQRSTLSEWDGVYWFILEPYGLQVTDPADHVRFLQLFPDGWHGDERRAARGLGGPRRPGY